MLKSLLLLGWFRVQPFLKYFVVLVLLTPVIGLSIHSTLAKQSEVKKITAAFDKLDNISPTTSVVEEGEITAKMPLGSQKSVLPSEGINSGVKKENEQSVDELVAAEKIPSVEEFVVHDSDLAEKLRDLEIEALPGEITPGAIAIVPNRRESQPTLIIETPDSEPAREIDTTPTDPIDSPHPIPWKWIVMTQENIGGKGGSGVRYYRSVPVISPDGRYAVYSRIQMEVKPEMYNSRVSSTLFVEDMKTKRLRVMAATSKYDPLLIKQVSSSVEDENKGKIGVLVPVSWSEKGDRFLARQFEGIFNTADATDRAVIWDRQKNDVSTVSPHQEADEHEKIAVLLGWSKSQPDNVLFRAGELGEEDWPLVQVAIDGKTVNINTDGDQPITFGEKIKSVWGDPQVASR